MWDDGAILAGASTGKLMLRQCGQCHTICHPPLPMCPQCQSVEWKQYPACGRARLHSWLVSIRPDQQGDTPRIVIVANLEEGVRFVSNLIDAPIETLVEAMPLTLCFGGEGEQMLPMFRPAEAS